jgi:hypothetical protein
MRLKTAKLPTCLAGLEETRWKWQSLWYCLVEIYHSPEDSSKCSMAWVHWWSVPWQMVDILIDIGASLVRIVLNAIEPGLGNCNSLNLKCPLKARVSRA